MTLDIHCICPVCRNTFAVPKESMYSRSGMVRCVSCREVFAVEPNRIELPESDVQEENELKVPTATSVENENTRSLMDEWSSPPHLTGLGLDEVRPNNVSEEEVYEEVEDKQGDDMDALGEPRWRVDDDEMENGADSELFVEHESFLDPEEIDDTVIPESYYKAANRINDSQQVSDFRKRQEPDPITSCEPEIPLLDLNTASSIGVKPPKPGKAYDTGVGLAYDDLAPLGIDVSDKEEGATTYQEDRWDEDSTDSDLSPQSLSGLSNHRAPANRLDRDQFVERVAPVKTPERRKQNTPSSYETTSLGRMRSGGVDEYIGHRTNPLSTIAWFFVTLGFVFLLGLQIKYFFVEKYEQHDVYRKYLVGFCKVAMCELSPRREPYRFTLTNTDIDLHPQQPGALRVTVKMVNEAHFSQPYPDLQLTLTDRVGRVVGRRVYSPDLYLPKDQRNLIGSGSFKEVVFDLKRPHEKAVGFVVSVAVQPNQT